MLELFPPREVAKKLFWFAWLAALLSYVFSLDRPAGSERYVGGSFWISWLIFLGVICLIGFLVVLRRETDRRDLQARRFCPTCGQPMPHTTPEE